MQQRCTMPRFQQKDLADRLSAQQIHQKVHRKPVSVPKGFSVTILTYLQAATNPTEQNRKAKLA